MAGKPKYDIKSISLDDRINSINLDLLAALKIIHHSRQNVTVTVTGQLLGLDMNGTLEVTDTFALPFHKSEDSDFDFEYEMLKTLAEVNVDNNTVGWYQGSYLGGYINQFLVDTQYRYQSDIPGSVVIIYDPLATSHGSLSLKAYKLTQQFMSLYKEKSFTKDTLSEKNFSFQDIFESIPVHLTCSPLAKSFLLFLESDENLYDMSETLDLSYDDFLEKNLEMLLECFNDLLREQGSHTMWQRNVSKNEEAQQQYIQKRKQDNTVRKEKGEELLPDNLEYFELEQPTLFKKIPEPSRMETLLIWNRIDTHCNQILKYSAQSLTKQYVAKTIDKVNKEQ